MAADLNALRDRLAADLVGVNLCVPEAFTQARTKVGWTDIEQHILERARCHQKDLSAPGRSAVAAAKAAQATWQAAVGGDGRARVVTLLTRAARQILQANGREMVLTVDRHEPGREILRWRFVSLALPPGILIAAATKDGFASPTAVRILDRSIAPDHPVAVHHVHHAAMMTFEELWESLRLRALLHPGDLSASLRQPRAFCPELHRETCPWGRSEAAKLLLSKYPRRLKTRHLVARAQHMAVWGDVVRQAFIAGQVLDAHSRHVGNVDDCLKCDVSAVLCTTLRAFIAGAEKPYSEIGTRYPWPDRLVRMAERARAAHTPRSIRRTHHWLTDSMSEQTAEERRFLVRAFAHLQPEENEPPDPVYETLLSQYLRVKTAVFRSLVHPPAESGLENFLEHFEQIKVYAPESERRPPWPQDEPGLNVRAMECRVAPDAWFNILRRADPEAVEHSMLTPRTSSRHRHAGEDFDAGKSTRLEKAWLIHFKRKGHGNDSIPMFGDAIRKMEGEADQIVRALDADPRRLNMLRGIDICGVEQKQPLWVSAETLRRVRSRARDVAGRWPSLRLQPLRLTIHCGEDFSWLTSGLRAVAEPFVWKLIERGDRLGHGIAITLHPKKWWRRRRGKTICVKRFDRLLDLGFLVEYAKQRTKAEERWLYSEIEDIADALGFTWNDSPRTDLLETARLVWSTLGQCSTRRVVETPVWRDDGGSLHERWIHSYVWSRGTQQRANEKISLTVDARLAGIRHERSLLGKARAKLINEVARWQVCIESNPSSNLVVGGLDIVMEVQEFLRTRPTEKTTPFGQETLTWSISTDDPITFSTTLADEYAYAWAGLMLQSEGARGPSYARALLDEAAATSMRMRFTLPQCKHEGEHAGRHQGKDRANN